MDPAATAAVAAKPALKRSATVTDAAVVLWESVNSQYLKSMAGYLVHSGLANALSWTKFALMCQGGAICCMVPPLWPVPAYWAYKKYKDYKASCADLLPEWTEQDVSLEMRLHNAIERREPKNNGYFTSRDGLRLRYYIEGHGPKHVLICNGVNCSWLLWMPVLKQLTRVLGRDWREEFKVVTWDYRGLFKSEAPKRTADFSVRALCEDGYDLLKHLKLEKWDVVCGWSTGVQASLEYAGLYPETVDRVFLVNGSHGHTLHQVFQPTPQWVSIPLMSRIMDSLIFYVRFDVCPEPAKFQKLKDIWVGAVSLLAPTVLRLNAFLLGRASLEYTMATNMMDMVHHGPVHCNNVLRILQGLDSHSSAYNLPELRKPMLVICGLLDLLTPAFSQYEIKGLAPKVKLVPMAAGTHHCILEFPQLASEEMVEFFTKDVADLADWGSGGIPWPVAWGLL